MNLENVFKGINKKMLIDFEEISSEIEHRLSKGQVRELEIVNEFLTKYVPGNIGIAHGEIISTDGLISPETDIILHEKFSTPFLLKKEGYQVLPIECVYVVIEVKSFLDQAQLIDSFKKIKYIKQMPKRAFEEQRGPLVRSTNLYDKNWKFFPVIGMVVSFTSIDLRKLKKALNEIHSEIALEHRIDSVWVLDKGMLVNASDTIDIAPSCKSNLLAIASDNPLMSLTVQLQSLLLSSWISKFRLKDYLENAEFGHVVG